MLINVSGSSGVGKTTISTIISLILTNLKNGVLHLCGDDLHKWERGDDSWRVVTHLNPEANNLALGEQQVISLLDGVSVKRDHYLPLPELTHTRNKTFYMLIKNFYVIHKNL